MDDRRLARHSGAEHRTELKHEWLADARRFGWNFLAAFIGRGLRDHLGGSALTPAAETVGTGIELGFYRLLSAGGGFTLEAPNKTVDYSKTPVSARYAFTFWAFPRAAYVKNLQDYVQWADGVLQAHRLPLQHAARVVLHQAGHAVAAVLHARGRHHLARPDSCGRRVGAGAWADFLKAFNEWAHQRGGIPLLNQSPFVKKAHVVAAYGERWTKLADWLRTVDPNRRM